MEPTTHTQTRDLQYFIDLIVKRKWIILLVFVLSVAAAWFYTKRETPVYQARCSVIIDRTPVQVLSSVRDVVQIGGHSYWAVQDYMSTQFEVIRGHAVTNLVLDRLQEQGLLSILEERLKSRPGVVVTRELLMEYLLKRVRVDPLESSMTVYVVVNDPNPRLAQSIANTYADAYADHNIEQRRNVILEANRELNDLVTQLKSEFEAAETGVYDFEREFQIGTFKNRRALIGAKLSSLSDKLTTLRIEKAELTAKLSQIVAYEDPKDIFKLGAKVLLDDPLIATMRAEYLKVRNEMTALSEKYGEKHPKMIAGRQRLSYVEETIRKQIKARVQSVRRGVYEVSATLKAIDQELEDARTSETKLNGIWMQYQPLTQRRDAAAEFYSAVRKRQTETFMSSEVETNNVRVQDYARLPKSPIKPRPMVNLMVGVVVGLLIGFGLAFLVDLLDNTVKTREELEEEYGLTFLGVLPTVHDQDLKNDKGETFSRDLITFHKPQSNIAELSRNIRTNLMFVSPEKPLHAILITSANPQEGKTTTSVNVAISVAGSGKRTLLVDTDMRRARLHRVFGVKRHRGVSEFLVRGGDVSKHIQETGIENLFILPAGSVPPNPSELLHSANFLDMLVQLRASFDFIIFDSPPVAAVTDALIISKLIDGIVLVVRSRKTSKPTLEYALKELLNIGVNVIGCTLNDLDLTRRRYYYYRGKYYRYRSSYYGGYYASDKDEQEAGPDDEPDDQGGPADEDRDPDGRA